MNKVPCAVCCRQTYDTDMKNRRSNLYIFMNLFLFTCDCNVRVYQRQFQFKSYGSLDTNYKILYMGNGDTFSQSINQCAKFCTWDRRCVGIEMCEISAILYRCRACCEWIKLEKESSVSNGNIKQCKYFEMENHNNNAAVGKPASMSSTFSSTLWPASMTVDDVTTCNSHNSPFLAHTGRQFNPWIQIDMQNIHDIARILIFNRQDGYGERLHNLMISVGVSGTENPCAFFQGPANTGDRLLIFCTSGSRGRYVRLTIQSHPGQTDILNVCEIQVFLE